MDRHSLQAQIDALTRLRGATECEIGVLTRFDIPELAELSLAAYGIRPSIEAHIEATDEMRLCFDGIFGTPLEGSFLGGWIEGELIAAIIVVVDPPVEEPSGLPQVIDLMVHPKFEAAELLPHWSQSAHVAVKTGERLPLSSESTRRMFTFHRSTTSSKKAKAPPQARQRYFEAQGNTSQFVELSPTAKFSYRFSSGNSNTRKDGDFA